MTIQYDPHHNIDGNMQRNESHAIDASRFFRVVTPIHSPFYLSSLVVKRNGVPLKEVSDYQVSHNYEVGTHRTARFAYGSIWIVNNDVTGTITVDYHPLGINEATPQQIADEREAHKDVSPSILDWGDVVGDLYFPPVNLIFDRDDWSGEERLISILNEIGNALATPGDDDLIEMCQKWLQELQDIFDTSPAHAHILDKNNPHGEEYGWIHALKRDGISRNTAKAFGKTLAELTEYVNTRCQTTADLTTKIHRDGSDIKAEMIIGHGVPIGNMATESEYGNLIHLMSGGADFHSRGMADTVTHPTKPTKLIAGKNELILHPDARGLTYNGVEILTRDTIGELVPRPGDGSDIIYNRSTPSVSTSGEGTGSSPILIEWMIPSKGTTTPTLRPVSSDWGYSQGHGGTPALLGKLEELMPAKLTLENATVNGKSLKTSVYLTMLDFDLWRVANLSDTDLFISDPQQLKLDTYTSSDHVHPIDFFGYGDATVTVKGIFRLKPYEDISTAALRSQDIAVQRDRYDGIVAKIDELMPAGVMTVVRFGDSGNELVRFITTSGWVMTFPNEIPLYYQYLRSLAPAAINLKELYPLMTQYHRFYIYTNVVDDVTSYQVYDYLHAEDEVLTNIGTIDVGPTGIMAYDIRNTTRLDTFREMEEHIEDKDSHILKPKDRDELGLGALVNAPPAFNMQKPTFQNVFDYWTRFSHGIYVAPGDTVQYGRGDAQPANLTEMNAWLYDGTTDSIVQPLNCGSFVGFISPTLHETYTFDTILSSNAADNDGIGVVLGFVTASNGRQNTLSFIARQDGVFGSLKGTALVYNRQQTSEYVGLLPTINIAAHSTWNVTGSRRVKVIRDGDNFTVVVYRQNVNTAVEETFYFNINTGQYRSIVGTTTAQVGTFAATFLNNVRQFRGAQPFGYASNSQPNSTYTNLQRPDEDGKNYYATIPELVESVSPLSSIRTYTGTANLAGKTYAQAVALIPLPVIKNYVGDVIIIPANRIHYYFTGNNWMAVCHVDATLLVTVPT